ncbi:TIGR00730 family Rossman fold protein [Bartonella tamiae]|uniref:Cytokinin riboside 5'-monophosphate phosphoribohydrolase n=1 Tax=Bartonella tamiae Th239 TaxID=1094558 RepID=J1JZT2_9HYPH|nr:TIGR00730 family Rossman fold protein [Bartonella tamiae]EJF90647.1 TIGR00730 family protein [Bartonella tamiae Th239]EJF93976.1 TIGR00730 family protein [Bartonella tamiae Th307]
MKKIKSICVYCGSSLGNNPHYVESAYKLGTLLAKADIQLVYGGGSNGIMGVVSKAVRENGGKVIGIIPQFLINIETSQDKLNDVDELIITDNMHQRKHLMFERSDAFIALPGGIGTLEEIVEMMTWAQLGRHKKPMAFANVDNFWAPITKLIDHMQKEGFIHTPEKINPLMVMDITIILECLNREAIRLNALS